MMIKISSYQVFHTSVYKMNFNFFTVFLLQTIFSASSKMHDINKDKIIIFLNNYVQHMQNRIKAIPDDNLKRDIEILFEQFKPGLEGIMETNSSASKNALIQEILPELLNVDNLLNAVIELSEDNVIKNYRFEDDAVDQDILLTVFKQLEDSHANNEIPPWIPNENNIRSTTELPYKVRTIMFKLSYVIFFYLQDCLDSIYNPYSFA